MKTTSYYIKESDTIKTLTLRLNEEHHQILEKKAKEFNISKNDFIRMLLDGEIKADKQDEILNELKEIKKILEESK